MSTATLPYPLTTPQKPDIRPICPVSRAFAQLVLPWPGRELSPNTRIHWAKLARAKKRYRLDCAVLARSQGLQKLAIPDDLQKLEGISLHVALTFCPPTRQAYDLDNALARMKAGLDGLADVLGLDDRHWRFSIGRGPVVKGGQVNVELSWEDGNA